MGIQKNTYKRCKYFYFFRGTLATHVHFYKGWVDAARRRGIPIHLITLIHRDTYLAQEELVEEYDRFPYFHIIPFNNNNRKQLFINLYFGLQLLLCRRVIVQLKKQDISQFDTLKKWFPNKLKCIIELEGDAVSENQYLRDHPYKPDFYNKIINSVDKHIQKLPSILSKADRILVLSPKFKELLLQRYPELDLSEKINVISTGVDCEHNGYSSEIRNRARAELGLNDKFVMTYIGNVYYSWQNLSRTIEMFKLIKEKIVRNAFLLLLVREQDHPIALDFLARYEIFETDYLLRSVRYDELDFYLNASDIGFLLRREHVMNEVASPGKFGDYVACGVPVIITRNISDYSEMISKTDFCLVLDDMDNDTELLSKIKPFLKHSPEKRAQLCRWTNDNVSINARLDNYIQTLHGLAE